MKTSHSITALTLGALVSIAALAQTGLPTVQHSGSVDYLSGGIGIDESTAIKAASPQWPLTLEFAVSTQPRADYASDVQVTVRDAHNAVALQTTASGPFLLVKLPPGQYTVDALYAGKTEHQSVTIVQGRPAKSTFVWSAAAAG